MKQISKNHSMSTWPPKVIKLPGVRTRMEGTGVSIPEDTSAGALQQLIKTDVARWQEVVQRANIKVD